jgi:phosphoenolpyruvate synthase/pyruvate phosphate dikinase
MKLSYRLSDSPVPSIDEIGSKGQALMRLFQDGFPVPNGFILTTSFFASWMDQLKATAAWANFLKTDRRELRDSCRHIQEVVQSYEPSAEQEQIMTEELGRWAPTALFAVRSSSPEEDLASASFAGGYKTILGVPAIQVSSTLPALVASSLDLRIISYKLHRSMDLAHSRLAVVVQEQVASDISGIAFSANPVTGDDTHAVLESNWGLGSTVVGGSVSPDHFLVDKQTGKIIERRLGRKERSIILEPAGGTFEREDGRHDHWTLDEEQLHAITTLLIKIERQYRIPVDMEWSIRENKVFILQVRPITELITHRSSSK